MVYFKTYKKRSRRASSKKKASLRRRSALKRPTVSMPVKKYVDRTIKRNVENKRIQFTGSLFVQPYTNVTNMNCQWLSLGGTMQVAQGTGQAQRIGNRVRVVKSTLYYYIRPLPMTALFNPVPKPLIVKIWIGYRRETPTEPPADFTTFLQSGGSSGPPIGFISDFQREYNRDKFVVYRQFIHKIGYADYTGDGASTPNQYFANNDFKYMIMRKLDITKYLCANVVYNDGVNVPTTRGLFMWMQIGPANNTVFDYSQAANMDYFIETLYEDA